MKTPFFFRKKFLLYYGLFVLLLLLVGIAGTIIRYYEAKAEGEIRWEMITVPMSLPIMGLAGYVIIIPMWFVHKVKQVRNEAIARLPEMFSPSTPAVFPPGEIQYGDADQVGYTAPDGRGMLGEIRFTNQRIVFMPTIDVRRMGELYGMPAPDLTTSIPLNAIRQCGFGLDYEHPKNFVVIENTGNVHTFTSIVKFNATIAMKESGWRCMQIGEHAYWIR